MKKSTFIFAALILTFSTVFAGGGGKQSVEVLSTKRDIFYFKVSHEFFGAQVEVLNTDGVVLMTDTVRHTKSLLDFYYEKPGVYTIRISKNGQQQLFTYEKMKDSPLQEIVTQTTLSLN